MTSRRMWVAVVVAACLILPGVACSSDGESGDAVDTTDTANGEAVREGDDPGDLSSYDDIDDLHQQLVGRGIECGLEYSGLRDEGKEVSICVIDGEQALLTVWDDPALVTEFAESDAAQAGDVAYGANWTIDVDSPATAARVADALDGTVTG